MCHKQFNFNEKEIIKKYYYYFRLHPKYRDREPLIYEYAASSSNICFLFSKFIWMANIIVSKPKLFIHKYNATTSHVNFFFFFGKRN